MGSYEVELLNVILKASEAAKRKYRNVKTNVHYEICTIQSRTARKK